jgi:hypothetical protein
LENNRFKSALKRESDPAGSEIYLKFLKFKKDAGMSNTNLVISEGNRWIK